MFLGSFYIIYASTIATFTATKIAITVVIVTVFEQTNTINKNSFKKMWCKKECKTKNITSVTNQQCKIQILAITNSSL